MPDKFKFTPLPTKELNLSKEWELALKADKISFAPFSTLTVSEVSEEWELSR